MEWKEAAGETAHRAPPVDPADRIAFVLLPSFSMIAFSAAIEPLRLANRHAGRCLYDWTLVSQDGRPVRASNGVEVTVDGGPSDALAAAATASPFDIVLVCSGLGIERWHDRDTLAWLRRLDRFGPMIGALCTGAHVLAAAGLLTDRRCAIHWESLPAFAERFPDIDASSDLFEVDGRRATCSGGTAALDMMLYLIALKHGGPLATAVSESCLVDRMRGPHDRQRLPIRERLGVHHPKLIRAIETMEANLAEPLAQTALAARVGLSRRQLERLFRRLIGRSPAQYYLELRLERARQLLYQSDMPIVDVAIASGFASPSHFSKCYRQMYSKSPRQERAASLMAL